MAPVFTVKVKWGKQVVEDVPLDAGAPLAEFRAELERRTGVPAAGGRQKIMCPGAGLLKDSPSGGEWAGALAKGKLKDGIVVSLMGTAESKVAAMQKTAAEMKDKVVFVEDLPDDDARKLAGGADVMAAGLDNLGNTCFFNSCVMALRSVPELREAVSKFPGDMSGQARSRILSVTAAMVAAQQAGPGASREGIQMALARASQEAQAAGDGDRSIVQALRELDHQLDTTTKASVEPLTLLQAFRIAYPNFAAYGESGIPMQQDAEEAYSQLVGVLDRELGDDAVSTTFGGRMREEMMLKGADVDPEMDQTKRVTNAPFDRLRCHIDNKTNFMLEGLGDALAEDIELDNKIWEKRSRITKLPKYATVQFVRFFWNQAKSGPAMGLAGQLEGNQGSKAKILRPVEYPRNLDLFTLCTPELQAALKPGRVALQAGADARMFGAPDATGAAAAGAAAAAAAAAADEAMPDSDDAAAGAAAEDDGVSMEFNETGEYELIAVISHKGRTADSGHYVAWVKDDKRNAAVRAAAAAGAESGAAAGPARRRAGEAADAVNEHWLLFDDETVTPVRWEPDVKQLSGKGGADWHIAYLCIYRSRNPTDEDYAAAKAAADADAAAKAAGSDDAKMKDAASKK